MKLNPLSDNLGLHDSTFEFIIMLKARDNKALSVYINLASLLIIVLENIHFIFKYTNSIILTIESDNPFNSWLTLYIKLI
jgi:hypothetical protein